MSKNQDDIPAGLGERIKAAIAKIGSYDDAEKETGIPKRTLTNYAMGINDIKSGALVRLAKAAGVEVEWLATGAGEMEAIPDDWQLALGSAQPARAMNDRPQEQLATGFGTSLSLAGGNPAPLMSLIPVVNVQASAGDGKLVFEEGAEHYIAYSKIWLEKMRLTPSKLFMAPSTGESMVPTINPGEFLLCSRAEHHLVPGDGIYLIRIDGHVLVKRMQVLPGKRVKITSDNTAYQAYEIALNDGTDFAVLGKVMFAQSLRWF